MRGYRCLKAANQLDRITAIKEKLTNTRLDECGCRASKLIFGAGFEHAELIVRQYLLIRVGALNLNRALLYALGKSGANVIHPLPPNWRKVLRQHGFKVAEIRSSLTWNCYIALFLVYGIVSFIWRFFESIREIIRPQYELLGRYAYFDTLTSGNLPQPCTDGRSHDIITWYKRWSSSAFELDTLCHSVYGVAPRSVDDTPVVSVSSAIPPLTNPRALMRYVAWGAAASVLAIGDLFRGRWWHALLLSEASSAATVRMQRANHLARDYLFHNSGWIYRRLWTYESERQGSRIIFYFYSTNCEPFKRPNGYQKLPYGWQAMNWPHYLVWDEYQADFVRRAVGENVTISVVQQIWFQTSSEEMPVLNTRAVAVFDVTPYRPSYYATLGIDSEFYVPDTNSTFLTDIHRAAQSSGYKVLWKRKRQFSALVHPKYRYFAERFSKSADVIAVDPDVSACRVIESSALVVSMPFTSTALMARELGRPSCYYDPTGLLQKDDRAAHGIPIIQGANSLAIWFKEQVDQSAASVRPALWAGP